MTKKTKKDKKNRSDSFAKSPHSVRKSKSINNRDLNEDDQQQITNQQSDEYLNNDNRADQDLDIIDIEEQEDREARRKKDEAQGKEQV